MILYDCNNIEFILLIIAKILYYVKIIIPILLIVLIIFDLVKVVAGNADEKTKKDAVNNAVKRVIYAVIVFLIPTIVTFVFNSIAKSAIEDGKATRWVGCWSIIVNNEK